MVIEVFITQRQRVDALLEQGLIGMFTAGLAMVIADGFGDAVTQAQLAINL